MKKDENVPIGERKIVKSNVLIAAKRGRSVREHRILNLCISKIDPWKPVPPTGARVTLSMQEIKEGLGIKGNSIYSQMKKVVQNFRDHNTYYYEDNINQRAGFFVLTDYVDYTRGEGFTVNFGSEATKFLYEIQNSPEGFSQLNLAYESGLLSIYSNILYELFSKHLYKINRDNDHVTLTYNINELKFILGLLEFDAPNAKKARELLYAGETDYDKLVENIEGPVPYPTFTSFKTRCILPAQKELKEYTDVRFEFTTKNKGNKANEIVFCIYRNTPQNKNYLESMERLSKVLNNNPSSVQKQDAIIEYIQELVVEQKLKISEARGIAEAAKYDIDIINKAYEAAKNSKTPIRNIIGWLISCINEKWEINNGVENETVLSGNTDKFDIDVVDFDVMVPKR